MQAFCWNINSKTFCHYFAPASTRNICCNIILAAGTPVSHCWSKSNYCSHSKEIISAFSLCLIWWKLREIGAHWAQILLTGPHMVHVRNVWFFRIPKYFPQLPHHQPCSGVLHLPVSFLWPFSQLYVLPFCQWDVIVCCFSIGNAFLQRLRLQFSAKLPFEGTSLKSFQPSTLLFDLLGWYKKDN